MGVEKMNSSPTMETKRLILREVEVEDAHDVLEFMSDHQVMKYMYSYLSDLDETVAYIEEELLYPEDDSPPAYAIELKKSGKVIGLCYFHSLFDGRGQVAFMLNQIYQHQGYMNEALLSLLEIGFSVFGLRRIEAIVLVDNLASERCLRKLGFCFEGILRDYALIHHKTYDAKLYSLLETDWRKER